MLQTIMAMNPATGTEINPVLIWVLIGSGVLVIAGIVFAVLSKKLGNKKGKGGKRR